MRQILAIALIAVTALAMAAAPVHAQDMSARRGSHDGHHDGDGHHGEDHDGHNHGRAFFRGPFVYWNPYPVYVEPTPGYWYYCPSANAYYPYVTYCLDAWVPVPAR